MWAKNIGGLLTNTKEAFLTLCKWEFNVFVLICEVWIWKNIFPVKSS